MGYSGSRDAPNSNSPTSSRGSSSNSSSSSVTDYSTNSSSSPDPSFKKLPDKPGYTQAPGMNFYSLDTSPKKPSDSNTVQDNKPFDITHDKANPVTDYLSKAASGLAGVISKVNNKIVDVIGFNPLASVISPVGSVVQTAADVIEKINIATANANPVSSDFSSMSNISSSSGGENVGGANIAQLLSDTGNNSDNSLNGVGSNSLTANPTNSSGGSKSIGDLLSNIWENTKNSVSSSVTSLWDSIKTAVGVSSDNITDSVDKNAQYQDSLQTLQDHGVDTDGMSVTQAIDAAKKYAATNFAVNNNFLKLAFWGGLAYGVYYFFFKKSYRRRYW